MKILSLLALSVLTSVQAYSTELDHALQTEYSYLVSQREALKQQKKLMVENFDRQIERLKKEVAGLQKQVVQDAANNDDKFEALALAEKRYRALERREASLGATYKRAVKTLKESETNLAFDTLKEKVEGDVPENLSLAKLFPAYLKARELLTSMAQKESFSGYYLDEQNQMRPGELTRLGRVAAFLKDQDQVRMLGPNGEGALKVLPVTGEGKIYLFDSLTEASRLQIPGSWVEKMADFGPVMFLLMMLAVVAGLFFVLVKL